MRLSRVVRVAVLLASLIGLSHGPTLAQDKVIGIGFRKCGNLVPPKAKGSLENKLASLGYKNL